jgi:hypothetical protein
MQSAKPDTIFIVSSRVSPFLVEVVFASEKPKTLAPSRNDALSNDNRVRVEGSKKSVAMILLLSLFCCALGLFLIVFAD